MQTRRIVFKLFVNLQMLRHQTRSMCGGWQYLKNASETGVREIALPVDATQERIGM